MTFDDFVSRLSKVRRTADGITASCPAHEDSNPSLSVSEAPGGKILIHDFGGCTPERIVAAMGLAMRDLMGPDGVQLPHSRKPQDPTKYHDGRTIEKAYQYRDANGALLYEVLRLIPKDFRQRRPDPRNPGEWLSHLKCSDAEQCRTQGHEPLAEETRRTLYRLDELTKRAREVVVILEGEKDVDSISGLGYLATCNTGGAGKWRAEYSVLLKSHRSALIIADKDDSGQGMEHARGVAASLHVQGMFTRIVLPPRGKDFTDFLNIVGAEPADRWVNDQMGELEADIQGELCERDRQEEEAEDRKAKREQRGRFTGGEKPTSALAMAESNSPPPEGFVGDVVFCRGTVGIIGGEPKACKTWTLMYLCGQIQLGRNIHVLPVRKGRTLFISQEMDYDAIADRMRKMFTMDELRAFGYDGYRVDGNCPFDFFGDPKGSSRLLRKVITDLGAEFVVIDQLSQCHTGQENDNRDMGMVLRVVKAVAQETDSAIVFAHQTSKPNELRMGANRLRGASALRQEAADILMLQKRRGTNGERSYLRFDNVRNGRPPDPLDIGIDMTDKHRFLFTVAAARRDEVDQEESEALGGAGGRRKPEGGGKGADKPIPIDRREKDYAAVLAAIRAHSGELGLVPVPRDVLKAKLSEIRDWSDSKFNHLIGDMVNDGVIDRFQTGKSASFAIPSKDLPANETDPEG